MTAVEKYHICLENCNGILTNLYKKRDAIGHRIDTLMMRGYSTEDSEKEYDEIVDEIDEICFWRKSHPGCLLEGDPGYREF